MRSILPSFLLFDLLHLATLFRSSSALGNNKEMANDNERPPPPPNLIIIITDDHGYHDVGFNGCRDIATPHLDALARHGVRFTNGYVSFPVCGPSRAGLLTGRYQDRFGFTTNVNENPADATQGLPLEEENIAEVLKKVGYTSAAIGKWHMGSHPVHHPLNRGFDHFFGFLSGGHDYFPEKLTLNDLSEVEQNYGWYRTRILNDHQVINITDYLTDELTDAANRFIDRHQASRTTSSTDANNSDNSSKPFFLYLAYNAPHSPLQATPKYLDRFPHIANAARRTYAAMVSAVDDGVGRIMANLQRHDGLEENTLVVFLSDNGGAAGPGNTGSSNWPLRGHKSSLYEGGMHVPFTMQWKGTLPAGLNYTHPIISLDILATIAALANVTIDPSRPLDGINLVPYLTGDVEDNRAPHELLFWRKFGLHAMAVRHGDMKLVSHNTQQNYGSYQLFNLSNDLRETNNLRYDAPNLTRDLLDRWEDWNDQMTDYSTVGGGDEWWKARNNN
jgi:arylsulfatase A-like enzyme